MANSATALVKFNQSNDDSNDQWLTMQPIGQTAVDDWDNTIESLVADQVPLQWTSDIDNLTESELMNPIDLESPIAFYYIAEKGNRGNPNEVIVHTPILAEDQNILDLFTNTFNRNASRYPNIIMFVIVSDRNILDDADIPGRLS